MNPITQSLEILGFIWNSRMGTYIYKNNANIRIDWEEVKNLKLERLPKFTKRRISEFKKTEREKSE